MKLWKIINEKREQLGLSWDEVAKKAKVKPDKLDDWVKGKEYPELYKLGAVCDVVNVSIRDNIIDDVDKIKQELVSDELKRVKRRIAIIKIIYSIGWFAYIMLLSDRVKYSNVSVVFVLWAITMLSVYITRITRKTGIQYYKDLLKVCQYSGYTNDLIKKHRKENLIVSWIVIVICIAIVLASVFLW